MEPKISIIVPIYNSENYLKRCVDSLINQTYRNIEIILVNDGSTDKSGVICNDYKSKYEYVKVIHHSLSSGAAGLPRNTGINAASGEYISFVDSDDWIDPNMIKILFSAVKNNNIEIAECNLIETNEFHIILIKDYNILKTTIEDKLEALKRIINTSRFSVCIRLYKKALINNIRFLENVMSEDVYFTIQLFTKIDKLVRIEVPLYYYHNSPNSITRKIYNVNHLHTIKSALFLKETLINNVYDKKLLIAIKSFVLRELLYHYKMLNYYPSVDPEYIERKRIKTLINENYAYNGNQILTIFFAVLLSVESFERLIKMNKIKNKIFKSIEY